MTLKCYNRLIMQYEIEIKSLLGTEENADLLREKILEKGANHKESSTQLNHYFTFDAPFKKLYEGVKKIFDEEQAKSLKTILEKGSSYSLRTREINNKVKLVIKASIDDTTSENGIKRMEFEEEVPLNLDELDDILLDLGFNYQAKWSRSREEYQLENISISLDKNAGYGWLAEFEMVLSEDEDKNAAENMIRILMDELEVEELDQDRLDRMFNYYNQNWKDYYGSNKLFVIE